MQGGLQRLYNVTLSRRYVSRTIGVVEVANVCEFFGCADWQTCVRKRDVHCIRSASLWQDALQFLDWRVHGNPQRGYLAPVFRRLSDVRHSQGVQTCLVQEMWLISGITHVPRPMNRFWHMGEGAALAVDGPSSRVSGHPQLQQKNRKQKVPIWEYRQPWKLCQGASG